MAFSVKAGGSFNKKVGPAEPGFPGSPPSRTGPSEINSRCRAIRANMSHQPSPAAMFESLKLWKFRSILRDRGDSADAFAAVRELATLGSQPAVELLIETLARRDGLARAAARELGRLGAEAAAHPLADLLSVPEVSQSASEALVWLGRKGLPALLDALCSAHPAARRLAATTLGEIGDSAAVEPLVRMLQADDDYASRTAAATALGQLKDPRAIWVLVATLKLRDESSPDRQQALEELRRAAQVAMRKIGDPLAAKQDPAGIAGDLPAPLPVSAPPGSVSPSVIRLFLLGDLTLLAENELISLLRELIGASEEISWANLENRPPTPPPHFASYEDRRRAAEGIGTELRRRGGASRLKAVLERDLNNYATLGNWWREAGLLN
jgi:hypothetical protein